MSLFRSLMMANAKPYLREVSYLQSVRGVQQWIDTGVWFDQTEDMYISAKTADMSTGRSIICSSHRDNIYSCISLEWQANILPRLYLQTNNTITSIVGAEKSVGVVYDISADYSPSRGTAILSVNGETYSNAITAGSNKEYAPMRLFLDHRDNNSVLLNPVRIYSLQIKKAGVLVRDFIPVLDKNSVPCMYDKVSYRLFYNQGSGQFSYGEINID